MDNKKSDIPVLSYTVYVFLLIAIFEYLEMEMFTINRPWLSHMIAIIFVTLCALFFLVLLNKGVKKKFFEITQELHNTQVSAEAANQELQAINQELQSTEDELRSTNDQLEQQKQDLDMLLQTIPEGIIRTDTKGKVLFCNKRILEETGLNREDVLNKDIKNVVFLDDRPAFAKEFESVFIKGLIKEMPFRSRNGTQVLADLVVLKDNKGQVNGTLSAIKEFSKTGKIIEELDHSRNELHRQIEEMQLLHRTTIDREKRIIDLKAQIEALKQELAKSRGAHTI